MLLQCRPLRGLGESSDRHPLMHGAHAPCYCNVARFAGLGNYRIATPSCMGLMPHAIAMSPASRAWGIIGSPPPHEWGSRPMLLQCRPLRGLGELSDLRPLMGLTPHALPMSRASRAWGVVASPPPHGAHAPCFGDVARFAGYRRDIPRRSVPPGSLPPRRTGLRPAAPPLRRPSLRSARLHLLP